MRAEKFIADYSPTPGLESIEIPWRLDPSTRVKIRVWDVVEAFLPSADDPEKPLPDATTVDTIKPANGIVIVIDIRVAESVALADTILAEAPEDLQIVVFSNYMDEPGASPVLPAALAPHIGRFYYIPGSFETNQGLVELANWLEAPLLSAKRKMYADLFRATDEDMRAIAEEFCATASFFTAIESANAHLPEFIPVKKPPPVTKPAPAPEPEREPAPAAKRDRARAAGAGDDDEFWGEGSADLDVVPARAAPADEPRANPLVQGPGIAAQRAAFRQRVGAPAAAAAPAPEEPKRRRAAPKAAEADAAPVPKRPRTPKDEDEDAQFWGDADENAEFWGEGTAPKRPRG
jgi:hypothetical protein